jgi:acylphosphatase
MSEPAPADVVQAHAVIAGLVQGVNFRAQTRSQAGRLGVQGWVRNLPDGTVELLAEGPRGKVEDLLAWCRSGPAFARVDEVRVTWGAPRGDLQGFLILRG